MKKSAILILFIVLLTCCENYKYERTTGYGIEFYLIGEYRTTEGSSKIISNTVKLSDSVLIRYDDIISYNSENYTFKITEAAANNLNNKKNGSIHGTPFAVTVNKELIYTGYFWCSFSSSMVNWVVIDPINYGERNELRVQIGYPGLMEGENIPDQRNDPRILEFLSHDNKLE